MSVNRLDPSFEDLISPEAKLRRISTGFTFTEGPVWHPLEECLYFSDIPGNVRSKWDGASTTAVMKPSNKGNGMTLDANLDLLVCEHTTSSVVRFSKDGRRHVLATRYNDKELNSPNDICVRSDGAIYFSDPSYGRTPVFGKERPVQLGFQGIYRLMAGKVELLVPKETFTQPNGLCFSPDERLLYVNDTVQANIRMFDVRTDGLIENGRIFTTGIVGRPDEGVADGMKCDASGNIWCTAPDGVWVYNPQGKMIGKVVVPEVAGNLHWGGADWKTLFICGSTSVYAIDVRVGPHSEPFMRAAETRKSATALAPRAKLQDARLQLDVKRTALIIQDMQNDAVSDGGAFSSSGSPQHCREQKAVPHIAEIAARCRALGVPVIHVWFSCPPGYTGTNLNAPLFRDLVESGGCVEGTWGVQPPPELAPMPGDHVVKKMRMSAWEGTNLEHLLRSLGRDIVIETGAWTNMAIEHTARTGADKGFTFILPEDACCTMNADWHRASIEYALPQVAIVTKTALVIQALK